MLISGSHLVLLISKSFVLTYCNYKNLVKLTYYIFAFAEPPEFVQKLPATKFLKMGLPLRLDCKVTGTPPLKISWYKNDNAVTQSNNMTMTFDGTTAVVEILSTSCEDDGVYTCEVQNDAGTKSCSTNLLVKG